MSNVLPAGTYVVDPVHSSVEFSVRHLMVSKVKGRFDEFSGTITVAEDGTISLPSTESQREVWLAARFVGNNSVASGARSFAAGFNAQASADDAVDVAIGANATLADIASAVNRAAGGKGGVPSAATGTPGSATGGSPGVPGGSPGVAVGSGATVLRRYQLSVVPPLTPPLAR